MKVFLLALAVCAASSAHGALYDLPAVASAKAAHFNAVQRAESIIANASPVEKEENRPSIPETNQHQLGVNVQDTPEVAAAKRAHFEAVRKAEHATAVANATTRHQPAPIQDLSPVHHQAIIHHPPSAHYPSHASHPVHHTGDIYYPSHGLQSNYPDHGHHSYPSHQHHSVQYYPVHTYSVPVLQTTQHKLGENVKDTPEVVAAKIAHFEAFRQAAIASGSNSDGSYVHSEPAIPVIIPASIPQTQQLFAADVGVSSQIAGNLVPEVMYSPVIYQPSKVVSIPQTTQHKLGVNVHDTPEVAAAKAAHLAAFRKAELAAAEKNEEESVPKKNLYANTARQYGQVPF